MKKIFGMLLACVMMGLFVTPVFAIEGEGSSSTNMEYVVEGSFNWSVPAKITVRNAGNNASSGTVAIYNNNLQDSKKVVISLVGSSNYNDGYLNLKKAGSNTYYPYILTRTVGSQSLAVVSVESEPTTSNPAEILDSSVGNGAALGAQFASNNTTPTLAGTYTDTLTFRADIVDAN